MELHNWIFNFNAYTGNWRACTRDQSLYLFSKPESNFLCSSNIQDIIALIIKAKGDFQTAKSLIK